jgi:hypothetical protein
MNAAAGNLGPLGQASCFPVSDFFSPLSGGDGIVKNKVPGLMRGSNQANTPLFKGVGARSIGDPRGWDPISVQEPKKDV